jgi:hypothetical protein
MKRVILKKRIYWWRFFFDTFRIKHTTIEIGELCVEHPYLPWVCRLMLPCADNYRPPKARNDNQPSDWWTS